MIDKNKVYKTRDGREVRIYATDGGNSPHLVHGAVKTEGCGWLSVTWCNMGRSSIGTELDIIEVRPRHKRTVWLTVWSFNYIQVMNTPEWQISKSGRSGEIPYACIKVELDYEEGEGL